MFTVGKTVRLKHVFCYSNYKFAARAGISRYIMLQHLRRATLVDKI